MVIAKFVIPFMLLAGIALSQSLCPENYKKLLEKMIKVEKILNPRALSPGSIKGMRVYIPVRISNLEKVEVLSHDGDFKKEWKNHIEIIYPDKIQGKINLAIYSKGKTYFCSVQISYNFLFYKFNIRVKPGNSLQ